jgi:hypothetical protein
MENKITTKKPMKTFVITVSKEFMKGHPRHGNKTFFKEKILSGEKIHTIRGNYTYWKKIVKQVNKGEAILSVREWSGKPYNSKQREIKQFTKLGIQKIATKKKSIKIDNKKYNYELLIRIANNDGLDLLNFCSWFPKGIKGVIIHFTDFRY